VGYMWDAKHGMHLIRQPSHSGGTQSVPFPSFFFVFVFCFFLGTVELRLQLMIALQEAYLRFVSKVCLREGK
jgi:hypothetical protein